MKTASKLIYLFRPSTSDAVWEQSEDLDTVSKSTQNLNQHQFYIKKNDSMHYYVEKQTTPQVQN
jgi:hypothetical protein